MKLDSLTEYAGFWRRLAAFTVDSLLFIVIAALVLLLLESLGLRSVGLLPPASANDTGAWPDVFIDHILPLVITVYFWVRFMGTPGKILLNCFVVDARTGRPVSVIQALVRYLAYFVSVLPLGLGILWIAWHPQKRGFHDLIARTAVIQDADDLSELSLEELMRDLR